ncbi:MAG: radical SAM protein [Elusimicrobiota bacterium]
MKRIGVPELGIVPGFGCGFRCSHCAARGEPSGGGRLSAAEIALLKETIREHAPRALLFTGGEPTLYLEEIDELVAAHPAPGRLTVRLTTNGHFAGDSASLDRVLGAFRKLDEVQLSYDRFHAEFLSLEAVGRLYRACSERAIRFCVLVSLTSPLDLALAKELHALGDMPIRFQKVLPIGRAKENGLAYRYPAFDPEVLKERCPNRDQVLYLCGRGFSLCCSSLVFNGDFPGVVHPTLEEHLRSRFRVRMRSSRFSGLMSEVGLSPDSLAPEHSSACTLCERIFSSNRSPADAPNAKTS